MVSLTENQETLLDLLLEEEGIDGTTSAIPVRKDLATVPLTYAQTRIWFLQQMNPTSAAYLLPTAVHLPISINPNLLNEAFLAVCRRHTILFMRAYEEEGRVLQKAGEISVPPMNMIDLSALDGPNQKQIVNGLLGEEKNRPFNLRTDPLIRLSLIRLQPNEHIILLTTHHIVADGWSINILFSELNLAYTQLVQGLTVDLPPLPVQYRDYAAWQPEWLAGEEVSRQFAYWKNKLQGPLRQTELPTDFARPKMQTFHGGQIEATISPGMHQALRNLSRRTGATLFVTLLAAFKVLLQRHIGQDEIIIGSPVNGRQRPELEPLVGLFLNTLVLRTDLGGAPSFLEALRRVRKTYVDAFANQDVPFEMLLAELLPARDTSRTPFFQVFFNMLEFDQQAADENIGAQFISRTDLNNNFDLTLYLEERQHGIDLTLVYNRDLFREASMKELLAQYQLLLDQVVNKPDLPINAYSLLTDEARALLPDPTAVLSDQWQGPVFSLLDKWAELKGEKTAVSDPNTQWTYQQVAGASSKLAHYLLQNGVQPGDNVAVYGLRCAALVPAIIGVLKAGAMVTILDSNYPEARLIQYLELAKPTGWLSFKTTDPAPSIELAASKTAEKCRIKLPQQPDAFLAEVEGFSDQAPSVHIGPNDSAFLTFTSGSSGKPKGVIGRHGSLSHFLPWMTQQFQFAETDRFSMLSGLGHDPLQRDIFTAVWVGAEICVPDPQQMWQPGYLPQWIQAASVTVAHLIPAMTYALTAVSPPMSITSLRLALFVGEPLKRHAIDMLQQVYPAAMVVNLYGASETQRAVSYHVVAKHPPDLPQIKQDIPIGVGMPGSQLLVLTPEQGLAGIGELGELYMRSPHLALGYLGEKEKTAYRFIQNPWTEEPGDRLFRTGDFGRFLADGQVAFDGRRDSQINILGLRTELSEIEAVITAHPAVHAAEVTAVYRNGDDAQIAAYVVKEDEQAELTSRQVQQIVKEKLPAPMVPAIVHFLNEFPITANGKIDYDALLNVDSVVNDSPSQISTTDPIEQALISIWQECLPADTIGIHDDFFALGGHSILAIQIFSRIRDEFDVDLNIGLLFSHSTIAELARLIRSIDGSFQEIDNADQVLSSNLIQIRSGRRGKPVLCCVHGAGGHVMFMQEWRAYFDDWSIYGLESPGVDGLSWPEGSLESTAADYVAALQTLQLNGPLILAGYSGGGVLAYEMAQQLQQMDEAVQLLVLIDTYHPSVSPRPNSWPERVQRLSHKPLSLIKDYWKRRVVDPLALAYIMHRYVKRCLRVPVQLRRPVLEYFFLRNKQDYQPKPYDGRTLLVRSQDLFAPYEHVSEELGWEGLPARLYTADVPGNHFTVVVEPDLPYLAEAITNTWENTKKESG